MKINIELSEKDLKALVIKEIQERTGTTELDYTRLTIEVKSKNNYKSEWEVAEFKAVYLSLS